MDELKSHDKQTKEDGVGPLYHRIYAVLIRGDMNDAKRLMSAMQTDLNAFSPQLIAKFEKVSGQEHRLKTGDEFQIHITGPWNGPVRVCDVTDLSFRLVTLKGHIEAGKINFKFEKASETQIRFEIESIARSRDSLIDFLYDKIPLLKPAQTEMWDLFCKKVVSHAEEMKNESPLSDCKIETFTEKRDEETGQWQRI